MERTPPVSTKRTLQEISPDNVTGNSSKRNMPDDSGIVGNMSKKDLLDAFGMLLDAKLENVATREDITRLQEEVLAVKSECDALRLEVQSLNENNKLLKRKLEENERRQKVCNLIFKGLPENNSSPSDTVQKFCEETLETGKLAIRNAYRIGRKIDDRSRPIVTEFILQQDLQLVMNNRHKLKNTNIIVHRDRTENARMKRSFLMELKNEVMKVNNNIKIELRGEQLIANRTIFTCSDDCNLMTRQGIATTVLSQVVNFEVKAMVEELAKKYTLKMVKGKDKRDEKLD